MRSTYNCLHCNTEHTVKRNYASKYCNNICQGKYKMQHVTMPRFERGEIAHRATLKRVLREKHGYECAVCGISDWNDEPLILQVDHINGLATDNRPENLRLICANCHSQTPSYCGRNVGKGRQALGLSRSD